MPIDSARGAVPLYSVGHEDPEHDILAILYDCPSKIRRTYIRACTTLKKYRFLFSIPLHETSPITVVAKTVTTRNKAAMQVKLFVLALLPLALAAPIAEPAPEAEANPEPAPGYGSCEFILFTRLAAQTC